MPGSSEENDVEPAVDDYFSMEMSPEKEAKYQQIVYGTKVDNVSGYEIDGYEAISRGVDKTIPTQQLATLLFRASRGGVPHILGVVPQKIMCNCLFVIDLKKLQAETDLYFDGLGTWDQNCGKITSYFRYIDGGAVDGKGDEQSTMFIRRTDRNMNFKAYTRVIVICKEFGLAAIQYYYKKCDETVFEIANNSSKGVRASAMYAVNRISKGSKRKHSDLVIDDGDSESADITTPSNGKIVREGHHAQNESNRLPSLPAMILTKDGDITAGSVLNYLKTHLAIERQERAEERALRKEELEFKRKDRALERQLRKEELEQRVKDRTDEMEMRRQELNLEKAKLTLEQHRWELDRKEKETFLAIIKQKLLTD